MKENSLTNQNEWHFHCPHGPDLGVSEDYKKKWAHGKYKDLYPSSQIALSLRDLQDLQDEVIINDKLLVIPDIFRKLPRHLRTEARRLYEESKLKGKRWQITGYESGVETAEHGLGMKNNVFNFQLRPKN